MLALGQVYVSLISPVEGQRMMLAHAGVGNRLLNEPKAFLSGHLLLLTEATSPVDHV